jgi:hypothetical protein
MTKEKKVIKGISVSDRAYSAFVGDFDSEVTIDSVLNLLEDGDINEACILLNVQITQPSYSHDNLPSWENDSAEVNPINVLFEDK